MGQLGLQAFGTAAIPIREQPVEALQHGVVCGHIHGAKLRLVEETPVVADPTDVDQLGGHVLLPHAGPLPADSARLSCVRWTRGTHAMGAIALCVSRDLVRHQRVKELALTRWHWPPAIVGVQDLQHEPTLPSGGDAAPRSRM